MSVACSAFLENSSGQIYVDARSETYHYQIYSLNVHVFPRQRVARYFKFRLPQVRHLHHAPRSHAGHLTACINISLYTSDTSVHIQACLVFSKN
jgi:hypothetical protein